MSSDSAPAYRSSVLFVDHTGELGGAELSLLDIASRWTSPRQVALFAPGPFSDALRERHVPVVELGRSGALSGIGRASGLSGPLKSVPALLGLATRLARVARSHDIIYANSQKSMVVAAAAAILSNRPMVWHLRDMLSAGHFSKQMLRVAVSVANRRAKLVIANSAATASAFREAGGKAPLEVVLNGIDPSAIMSIEPDHARATLFQELTLPTETRLIGVFSRLSPWKGQHNAIHAIKDIPGVHLALVGAALFGESAYENELRQLVRTLGLGDRVHFLGFRRDIPMLMNAVDVVVHSSTAPEPFGRVIVEGMMAGKPVVATRAGGVIEIIQDGVTGLLVPPDDVEALAFAVRICLDGPESGAMAKRGRQAALDRFALSACIANIEACLQAHLGRRG